MIKAVIFDVDGTLVDSVDLHARAWQETFAHFGKHLEADFLANYDGSPLAKHSSP